MGNSDSDSDLDVRGKPAKSARSSPTKQYPESGLVHSHAVKEMLDKSRMERYELLAGGEEHGGGAAPVHRIGGRVVTQAEWKSEQQRLDPRYRKERQRELDREFEKRQDDEWKRGLEQSSERLARAEEAFRIAKEPLGKSSVAKEYDDELRGKQRWDDPLSKSESVSPDKPKCRFQAPTNRFNIHPGYRWDGVVRGTNYETRWFERSNEQKSKKNLY
jgi:hypothetical protein